MGGNYDNGDNIKSKAMYDAIAKQGNKNSCTASKSVEIRPLTIEKGHLYTYKPTIFQILSSNFTFTIQNPSQSSDVRR